MSRARVHEVSSPISLFPFIGILLCTMGALLVVLVAVSRSARDAAQEQVQANQQAAPAADKAVQKKMNYVKGYVGTLNKIRSDAERKLRNEHARLSHVEDHIRRLQEKMRSLQVAAVELEELEKEHYDDREQAERETQRLNELVEESRKQIAALQEAATKDKASYALVPYEGPNGTFRRPIYIECLKDEVVLQPEGVRITANDLRPPFGPGNPLAAALRASRDHLVRLHPNEGKSRETEPYPLLLVRPDGLVMFDRARQAIDAGDFDLGFELCENDWKLKYPQPDPQLAGIQQDSLEQARTRQEVLAAAAPRAYRGGSMPGDDYGADDGGFGGGFEGDRYGSGGNESGGGFKGGGPDRGGGGESNGTGRGGGDHQASGSSVVSGSASDGGHGGSGSGGSGGSGDGGAGGGGAGAPGSSGGSLADGGDTYGAGGGSDGTSGSMTASGGGGATSGGAGTTPIAALDPNAPPELGGGQQNVSMMVGSPPPDGSARSQQDSSAARDHAGATPADARGKDWALRQKPQRSIPIRRTIRVAVREDQLTILPDDAPKSPTASTGKVVPMKGDTVESLDEFVKQVRNQIDGWGIAGNGLYWRPVIILDVAPEGERRANDLARLLKNSGLELKNDATATNAPQGKSYETR